jgi:hypothetical protein
MSDAAAVPEETQAEALLRVLTRTAGEQGVVADTRFRELLDAFALDRQALVDTLGEGRWPAFLAGLAAALLRQPARLSDYVDDLRHDASDADDADQARLCLRRSAIQFLLDDLAGTAVAELLSAAPLADIDARLARIAARQGPVAEDERLENVPASHHWWRAASEEAGNEDETAARDQALALAEALAVVVEPVLRALHGEGQGALLAALRPRPGDAARVFAPELAAIAETAFAARWPEAGELPVPGPGSRLDIHAAPAGLLLDDNALSRHFPGGYRRLAPHLQPQRVWVAWKVLERGASAGIAYDGLVWIDDHWAWFPKPFRVLREVLDALAPGLA